MKSIEHCSSSSVLALSGNNPRPQFIGLSYKKQSILGFNPSPASKEQTQYIGGSA